jgi:hypothetical protein
MKGSVLPSVQLGTEKEDALVTFDQIIDDLLLVRAPAHFVEHWPS